MVVLVLVAVATGAGRAAQSYVPRPADPLLEPWRLRTYPDMSGLGAECMAEGPDGTLWFGTPEMVWSYNGFSWTEHPTRLISGGSPRTLCASPDGVVYAGGRWGIIAWEKGAWTRIFPAQQQESADVRKLICARDGTLWAATDLGALSYDGKSWTLYTDPITAQAQAGRAAKLGVTRVAIGNPAASRLRLAGQAPGSVDLVDIAEDSPGWIWAGTSGGQILRFAASQVSVDSSGAGARERWELFDESDGVKGGRTPSILPLREGPVWVVFGSNSGHANIFDAGEWRPIDLVAAGVPGDVHHPLQTHDGTIWLSSRYVVSAFCDGSWRNYAKPEVPIPSATNFLVESRDGALWIAGPSTEIVRVDYDTGRWITLHDLIFEWESPSGAQWFLHRSGRVVQREHDAWTSYGVEDGVIDTPVTLVGAGEGEVWVAGSHGGEAATAHFRHGQWTRHILENFSWGVDWRGAFRSSDGSLWFSAAVDSSGPANHKAGIMRYLDGQWIHHHQPGRAIPPADDSDQSILLPATQKPQPIGKFFFMGETADGRIFAGQRIVAFWDGQGWTKQQLPEGVRIENIEAILTTHDRELWVGTRAFGAVRFDGSTWHAMKHKGGLVANSVRGLAQTSDGSIWAATERDISRYDGAGWTGGFFPPSMVFEHEGGSLRAGRSRDLWVNHFAVDWMRRAWSRASRIDTTTCEFWTRCHDYESVPPETTIETSIERVSPPGNLAVLWRGRAPWRTGDEARLQFSHRLDDGAWSPFSSEMGRAFFTLPPGSHRLEVRARDRDFNVDPTPAVLEFIVQPPVWRQGWFIGLVVALSGLIVTQSVRVFLERGRLLRANRELAAKTAESIQAGEALRQSRTSALQLTEQLTTLQLVTHELASIDSTDALCRRAVELGRARLGFERMSIWFIDEARQLMHGSYGTDEQGRTRDERTASVPLIHDGLAWQMVSSREPVAQAVQRPLADDQARTVGEGQNAMGAMWDGDAVIGVVSVDNLLHHQPVTANHLEVLRQYAAALGHLITRKRADEEIRRLNTTLEQRVIERTEQLAAANRELEAFSYSVSHDLRTPLRSIDGFSQILVSDYHDKLDGDARDCLQHIRSAAQRMAALIDAMLSLARVTRGTLRMAEVDLSNMAREILAELARANPEAPVEVSVAEGVVVEGDSALLRNVLENLLGNAWKFSARRPGARIEFGAERRGAEIVCHVRDNGAGFDRASARNLFGAFQRFHTADEFPGTGVGLATVQRIIHRHGGWVEAESTVGAGATFFFALPVRSWTARDGATA